MAAVDVIVEKFAALWSIRFIRVILAGIFFAISIVGSFVNWTQLVPETYFSNRRNVVNMYFVKVSWGWTLLLLTPFILFTSYKNLAFALRRLSSLVVATAVWYTFTKFFTHINNATSTCHVPESEAMDQVPHDDITSCRNAGGQWYGFAISGHSFILSYSALIIAEEMSPMVHMVKKNRNTVLDLLYVSLNWIVIIWIWMFVCTSVYFHSFPEKLLGTVLGIVPWFLTYRIWYSMPFSPGLPYQPKEQRQLA
ncbi:fat storage-inducing transmembrane protein 2 [Salmo trutta]|uniref:Fat storage inducing transmembrane protein 2 n=1 Tax=Salmo trutta TaxID=8032 RepID=A0A674API5_SALTR|nr:fat storage-inducing transmembrane protein 2-like [Salmo trutta]